MNRHLSDRRNVLRDKLGSGLVVLPASTAMQRSADVGYRFAQESNFLYLTGIEEPDWRLVLEGDKSWLIAPDIEEVHRVFDGALSFAEAKARSGVDVVLTNHEGVELLARLAKTHNTVYTLGPHAHRKHFSFVENPAQARLTRQLKKQFSEVKDCRKELARMRAIKQPEEVALIRNAVDRTCQTFAAVQQKINSLQYEYEIEAEFTYDFRRHNYQHGYEPIVAAGKNACTLHYVKNQTRLHDGQIILLDIGASTAGYTADITRTYGYGSITARQRAVHAAVETAHHQITELLRPGYAIRTYLKQVDEIMKAALASVGLSSDEQQYRRYFPHAISHGLGVDVHDSLGGYEEFQPGMVLTVEPGIYIPDEGIGVRIEDDILITATGRDNLSGALSTTLD